MKKGPAKKTAPTPKRKYKPRKKKDETGGGVDKKANHQPTELLQLEKVDMASLARTRRIDLEVVKMEDLLKKIKVQEGFLIKKAWVKYIWRIVDDAQLKITIRTFGVVGNDKVRRVVRLS